MPFRDPERGKTFSAEPKPARPEDVPKATHAGVSDILGVKTRVYRLDDGRAVIDADDFHKLLEAMGLTIAKPPEGNTDEDNHK